MKTKNFAAMILLGLTLAACGGGGGGGGGGGYIPHPSGGGGGGGTTNPPPTSTSGQTFVDNLNYDDAVESYFVAKDPSLAAGTIIVKEGNGTFWGIDIDSNNRFDNYDYDLDYYLDSSFQVFYTSGNLYEDVYGNLYEKTTEVSKDLEKVGAVLSKARAKDIGVQLSANYGLSESRGIELGQMLVEYKDLKKSRAITAKDDDRFSQMAFGSKVSEMAKALDKSNAGDSTDMDALITTAAETNGTTPEHVRDLFSSVLAK